MPDSFTCGADIRLLDSGYAREVRALLFQAYRHEPTYCWLFESSRSGYEKRVLATVRERVKQHFLQDLPALGLFLQDRLIGAALIAPPQRRLGVTESWAWRMRMVMNTGLDCTLRYLQYHEAVQACISTDEVHMLPMLGLDSAEATQAHAEQLMGSVHDWCAADEHSRGVVLDTGNPRYLAFYEYQGYTQVGEVAIGPVTEHVFFHPNPQKVALTHAVG